jgi:hypothetical protein
MVGASTVDLKDSLRDQNKHVKVKMDQDAALDHYIQ